MGEASVADDAGSVRVAAIGVAALAVVTFVAALPNGMLGDDSTLWEQRLAGVGWGDLLSLLGQTWWGELHAGGLYRPLALALLAIQKLVFASTTAVHAVSLAIHAACSVLCLLLLRRLALPVAAAFAGASLFACHPIHAEAVTTIHGQPDLWAALFAMAGLERALSATSGHGSPVRTGVLAGLLGMASLLCKESAVLLPGLAILLRGTLHHGASGLRRWLGAPELLFGGGVLAALLLRVVVLGSEVVPSGESSVAWGYPLWARANLVVVSVGTYLRLLVLPWGQTIYYGHLRDAIFQGPTAELAWVVGGIAAFVAMARLLDRRVVAFSAGWLALTLVPVSNLLPIGVAAAERCLYLPSVALAGLAAGAWARWAPSRLRLASAVLAAAVALSLGLSVRVVLRWRTPLSHWQTTAADHPRSPLAHATVARLLLQELSLARAPQSDARWSAAAAAIERALALNANSPEAWRAKGLWSQLRGDCAAALPALERAVELRPGDAETLDALRVCGWTPGGREPSH